MALLTWLGAYPVITITLGVLGPITTGWPLPLRTLLISGLMVAALTWGVLPALRAARVPVTAAFRVT